MNSTKRLKDKAMNAKIVKCSNCNRELRSSSTCIEDHQNILCQACYLDLAFPFLDSNYHLQFNLDNKTSQNEN